MNVDEIAREIVAREGGFVNDPADPGGATKHGVTIGTMRALGLDKTGDGQITVEDVKALTRSDAVRIFRERYFHAPPIDLLPKPLHAPIFDMQVNAGSNAVRILQRLLAEFDEPVTVDGLIGPQTAEAAKRAFDKAGQYLVDAYAIARRNYYFRLADRKPRLRKFARTRAGTKGGWIRRAEEFMRPRYRMTEAEFAERVKAWG